MTLCKLGSKQPWTKTNLLYPCGSYYLIFFLSLTQDLLHSVPENNCGIFVAVEGTKSIIKTCEESYGKVKRNSYLVLPPTLLVGEKKKRKPKGRNLRKRKKKFHLPKKGKWNNKIENKKDESKQSNVCK